MFLQHHPIENEPLWRKTKSSKQILDTGKLESGGIETMPLSSYEAPSVVTFCTHQIVCTLINIPPDCLLLRAFDSSYATVGSNGVQRLPRVNKHREGVSWW